ncbi:MAG TPA: hypothetical protein VNT28_04340 [Candidatus Limnocylindrales bacterium]|jgi:hypothetical protein|nr:hypothetical protein [Candidatus Limnocylindrales bacterium]
MSRGMLRLVGTALLVYGLAGTLLLGVIGVSIARPLDDITSLGSSLGGQRDAALAALEQSSTTIVDTSAAVRNMDTSLAQANQATARAAGISRGMAQTMRELAFQMQLTVLGIQPLIGLAPGFDATALQFDLLADDVAAIAAALEQNRNDTIAIANGLDELGRSIDRLRVAVADSPDLSAITGSVDEAQLGLLALIGWLLVAAVGCMLAGLGCWWASFRRRGRASIEPTA